MDFPVYAVQLLSRDCIPDDFMGRFNGPPFDEAPFVFDLYLAKAGIRGRRVGHALEAESTRFRPLVTYPWARNPDIGAVQYIDPYYDDRWPTFISLQGTINLVGAVGPTTDQWIECAEQIQRVLWGSFKTMDELAALPDQTMPYEAYRWMYLSEYADFYGNPIPNPNGSYVACYPGAPAGPGFTRIEHVHVLDGELPPAGISIVWSQGISEPSGKLPADIEKRVQEIKQHWNAKQELSDADRYLAARDVKGSVRAAASALEASLNSYRAEWRVKKPPKHLGFDEKIDNILASAGRPRYSTIDRQASATLGFLYQARNKMHEGDCYYTDPVTKKRIDVDHKAATAFVECTRRFVLWLDAIA